MTYLSSYSLVVNILYNSISPFWCISLLCNLSVIMSIQTARNCLYSYPLSAKENNSFNKLIRFIICMFSVKYNFQILLCVMQQWKCSVCPGILSKCSGWAPFACYGNVLWAAEVSQPASWRGWWIKKTAVQPQAAPNLHICHCSTLLPSRNNQLKTQKENNTILYFCKV